MAKAKEWTVYDVNGGGKRLEYEGSEETSVSFLERASILIYPNPAMDIVRIEGALSFSPIRLYGMDGTLVLKGQTDGAGQANLAVRSLIRGTYVLSVGGGAASASPCADTHEASDTGD